MTQEQILKKAIEKAIKNGWTMWNLKYIQWDIVNEKRHSGRRVKYFGIGFFGAGYFGLKDIIFDHDFAKAFFGRKENPIIDYDLSGEPIQYMGWEWQYHLQQMVLSNDPINYLRRFL